MQVYQIELNRHFVKNMFKSFFGIPSNIMASITARFSLDFFFHILLQCFFRSIICDFSRTF